MSRVYMMGEEIVEAVHKKDYKVYGRNLLPTNPNLYTSGNYIHYKFQDKPMEYLATLEDKDTEVDMSGVFIVITTQEDPRDAASSQWFMRNGVEVVREKKGKNKLYFSVYPRNIETLEKVFKRYRIKIERSTIATDWSPAPEDLINSLKPQTYPLAII